MFQNNSKTELSVSEGSNRMTCTIHAELSCYVLRLSRERKSSPGYFAKIKKSGCGCGVEVNLDIKVRVEEEMEA